MSNQDIKVSKELSKLVTQLIYSGATLSQLVEEAELNPRAVSQFNKTAKELLKVIENTR